MEKQTDTPEQQVKSSPRNLRNIAINSMLFLALSTSVYLCGNRVINFNKQNARHVEAFLAKQGKIVHIHHVYMTNGADGMQYYRFEATDEAGNEVTGHFGTDFFSVRNSSIYLER